MATGLDAQQQIFKSNPDDRRAFEALEEHYFLEGDWEALARVYRARLEAPSLVDDVDQRSPLLFRLGQILEERILDLDAAAEIYWILARLDPTNRPALRQLRGIHKRRSQWDMVLQIAELESATQMPAYDRAAFEAELGHTWKEHLGDPEEARHAYERALEADPDFPAALEGLAQLHQDAGRLRDAATIIERLTDRLTGPERAPVWIALGTLYAGELADAARARKCFAAALDDDPFQAPAVEWSLLLATAAEDWPTVSELLESRFDLASGARSRAAIAVEASQIQLNHLGAPASARAWVDRALELGADEPAVLLAACDVERRDGDRDQLLEHLDQLITVAGRHAPRASLIEAAELHADFGHADRALEAVRRAAERPGGDDERVLILQARLLREGGSKRELAEVLETLTELDAGHHPAVRAAQLRELAALQEDDLGDEAGALLSWRRAFDLESAPGVPLDALDRLYRKRDDWGPLCEVLERALEAGVGDGSKSAEAKRSATSITADLSARLGQIVLDQFDDETRAQRLFESALECDESCRPALAGLRKIADSTGDPDLLLDICSREARECRDAGQMRELTQSVLPILEGREDFETALDWVIRWTDLASEDPEALECRASLEQTLGLTESEIDSRRLLARIQTGRVRALTLERQAALHQELGQPVEAATALELTLEAQPESTSFMHALCDVYRGLERPTDLVRILRLLVDRVPSIEQADPLEELAATLQDPLGDLDTAIVVRWRLADLPDAPAEAAGKLESLLEMSGRYAELAHLLTTRRQQLGDDDDEAFELDMRRATLLLDSLGQCDEAAEIFSGLHERHPESEEIIVLLERSLRGGDDPAALCALLGRRAEWETNEERSAAFQLEQATLMEEAMGEPHNACDLYERILREHGETPAANSAERRLELLLESTGQWSRLIGLLETRATELPDLDRANLREQIATLYRERLHDLAGCAGQLELVAESGVVDRVHVWQQLEEIYAHELDRPADWLRVVESELANEPAPDREFNLRVNAARLCLDDERRPEGHDASEAFEHYERVLILNPSHPEAAEVLANHSAAEGRYEDCARILKDRLAGFTEQASPETTDLQLRLATLYTGPLKNDALARPLLEAAYAEIGAVARVADPLAELLGRCEDSQALSELARAVLGADEQAVDARVWRVRLGASEHALGNFEEAAGAYRTALAESPDDREIEDALIEIYERVGEPDPLTELLEKRLPYAREDETLDLRLRLARLHADGRNDPEEALRHLEWVLDSIPQHRDAFDRAVELASRMGDPNKHLSLLDRALATTLPDAERAEILERRARLLTDELDSADQAVLSFRECLSFDPDRTSARHALRNQLEGLERWPAVLDCFYLEAMQAAPHRREELYEEAAEIAWSKVSPDASLPWLARLREDRPEDPEIFARLVEVHRRAGRFEAALRGLDEELRLRSDTEELRALHMQRARLLERELHAPGRAIQAYRDALALGGDEEEVLEELDRLFHLMDRPAERAEILERRVKHLSGEALTELRRTIASIYCVDLAKPELAIPHLDANVESVRGQSHDEMAALGALEAALRASGRHDSWAAVAERQLELISADPSIAENTPEGFQRYLREELARTWDELMGDADRALAHLRVLCEDPARIESSLGERMRALLRRTGRQRELASELTRLLELGNGNGQDWLELARLREEVLLDLPGARDAYQAAQMELETPLDAIRGRRRTSERLRDWESMAGALEEEARLENQLQKSERAALARRLGAICWQRLGSGERAAAGYQLALDLDPRDLDAMRAMISVQEACGVPDQVVTLYRSELELLDRDDDTKMRRREIWLRLATLCAENCDQPSEAIQAYNEAAKLERLAAPDELRLARLYEAIDDQDAFFETFSRWCDRDDTAATVRDHLELAKQLVASDRIAQAAARAERATGIEPESAAAWSLRADLARDMGELTTAAEYFQRAADHASAPQAAGHCIAAAECLEASDGEAAYGQIKRAIELDPSLLTAQVIATRVAADLERPQETLRHAERAIELSEFESMLDEDRLSISVLGGRAAREISERDASRELFRVALDIDPDHVEALEGVGQADFEDGDYASARVCLERRLELGGDHPERAHHLSVIARGLEADQLLDAAWSRYEEAIDVDRKLESAHEGLVRVHERAGRTEEALVALERWSEASTDSEVRACAAFRAAEHALALDRKDTAIEHLEYATETDPQLSPAWLMLCELVAERDTDTDTRGLCERALVAMDPGPLSAQISLRSARLAEIAGDTDTARERYGEAARWDPRASEAVLSESRLARMAGDWVEADGVLSRFLEAHPDQESPTLAHVHLERGRLLSGPLEDFDAAVDSYEAALRLQPSLGVARTALGRLLLHSPERWREALALHREILEASPTTASSLRALSQLAGERGVTEVVEGASVVLTTLGLASPEEAAGSQTKLRIAIHPGPPMANDADERLRRIAHQVSEELTTVIAPLALERPTSSDSEVDDALRQIAAIEDDLSAPGLSRLSAEDRSAVFSSLAALFLDPGGNGADDRFRAPLEEALGRWTRRKVRRIVEETSEEEISSIDHQAWGEALRAIAAAQVVDRTGGELQSVLRALIILDAEDEQSLALEGAEIATLAASSDAARRLLARISTQLCERLERDR